MEAKPRASRAKSQRADVLADYVSAGLSYALCVLSCVVCSIEAFPQASRVKSPRADNLVELCLAVLGCALPLFSIMVNALEQAWEI